MKTWYIYHRGVLVDVVTARCAESAVRISSDRTIYRKEELEAHSVVSREEIET
jgi:hypothetical protein